MKNSVLKNIYNSEIINDRIVTNLFPPFIAIDNNLVVQYASRKPPVFINATEISGLTGKFLPDIILNSFKHLLKEIELSVKERKQLLYQTSPSSYDSTLIIQPLSENDLFLVIYTEGKDNFLFLQGVDFSKICNDNIAKVREESLETHRELDAANAELKRSNTELISLNQELEASKEELEAMNEELIASQEEMEAMNEELVASHEELFAMNTKLIMANEELELKYNEIETANARLKSTNQDLSNASALIETSFKETTSGIIAATLPDYELIIINDSAIEILGLPGPSERYVKKSFFTFDITWKEFFPDGKPVPFDESPLAKAFTGEISHNVEHRIIRSDESERWILINASPISDINNKITGGFLIFSDITKLKSIEIELRKSEERFRMMAENIDEGLSIIVNYERVYSNNRMTEITGYTRDELKTINLVDLAEEEEKGAIKSQIAHYEETKTEKFEISFWIKTKNGDRKFIINRNSIKTSDNASSMYSIISDFTRWKTAEESLQESEKKYKQLINFLPISIYEADINGKLLFTNRTGLNTFKITDEDIEKGINIFSFIPDDEILKIRNKMELLMKEEITEPGEYMSVKKNGEKMPIEVYTSIVKKGNVPVGFRGAIIDLTEKKKMEEEHQKTNKLESIGILAGGIAHDFNNFLTAIMGNISLAKYDINDTETISLLEEAEKATLRARNLTHQLLTFSKGGAPVKENARIEDIIKDSTEFTLRGSKITCEYIFPDNLWSVNVDIGQISQVIQNLVINAKQSMEKGGKIHISLNNETISENNYMSLGPGRYINISIRDEGCGIEEKNIEKIFDPYFTTKQKGSGLGLSISYSIVKKHNGAIWVKSVINEGSCFSILLPAAEPVAAKDSSGETLDVSKQPIRVLFMDDEESLRTMMETMFKKSIHRITTVRNGTEAVEEYLAAMKGDPFDIVLLDLTIVGSIDGIETLSELKKIDPKVRAIVTSGYADGDVLANYKEYGFKNIITKPFQIKQIFNVIYNTLKD